jgi:hypothetical protein
MTQKVRHTTYKCKLRKVLKEKWESKEMHGHHIRNICTELISQEDTFLWLLRGDPKAEIESEITAAQNRTLQTKYHATKKLQTDTESRCRLCQQYDNRPHCIGMLNIGKRTMQRHDR